mgnify:CR=1 FL=1
MNKQINLSQICFSNFKSYLEYAFLEESFSNLLPASYFDKIKQKLESDPNFIQYIY